MLVLGMDWVALRMAMARPGGLSGGWLLSCERLLPSAETTGQFMLQSALRPARFMLSPRF